MAVTLLSGRQEVIWAYVDVSYADIASGTAANAIALPVNAIVVSGDLVVTTAFNSGTSDVVIVGDVTTTNRYIASTTIAAASRLAVVPTGFTVTATQPYVRFTWTAVGTAATAGAFRLGIGYIVKNRSAFSQG